MFCVPLKFGCDIVPSLVTPRGIWPQHDQTKPLSYYMRGKSELTVMIINFNCYDLFMISTFVPFEG